MSNSTETTFVANSDIFSVLDNLDRGPKITALRGICNSTICQSIYSALNHATELERTRAYGAVQNNTHGLEADLDNSAVDQRNEVDLDAELRSKLNDSDEVQGENNNRRIIPNIRKSSYFTDIYLYAADQLSDAMQSKWDRPMTPETMYALLMNSADTRPETFYEEYAKMMSVKPEEVKQMEAIRNENKRAVFEDYEEDVMLTINSFIELRKDDDDIWPHCDNALENMGVVTMHKLTTKVISDLAKEQANIGFRALDNGDLLLLQDRAIYDAAIDYVGEWLDFYEEENMEDLQEAADNGVVLLSINEAVKQGQAKASANRARRSRRSR